MNLGSPFSCKLIILHSQGMGGPWGHITAGGPITSSFLMVVVRPAVARLPLAAPPHRGHHGCVTTSAYADTNFEAIMLLLVTHHDTHGHGHMAAIAVAHTHTHTHARARIFIDDVCRINGVRPPCSHTHNHAHMIMPHSSVYTACHYGANGVYPPLQNIIS